MRKLEINEAVYEHIVITLQENIANLKTKVNQELAYFYDVNDYADVKKHVIEYCDEIANLKADLEVLYSGKYYDNEDE